MTRELSVDQLARAARTTVRNVRAYQDRGLLPPPERRGRRGIYTEAHLARLRVIMQLLDRGYSIANIAELLEAWQNGSELGPLLGLEAAITSPFTVESPAPLDAEQLGGLAALGILEDLLELGLVERDGARAVVPSPRTVRAGAEIIAAGVPGPAAIEQLRLIRRDVERIAARLIAMVVKHLQPVRARLPQGPEVARLAKLLWRLRPLAAQVVDAELARALEIAARAQLGARLDRVLKATRNS